VSFSDCLEYGQAGESLIARWLIHRGNSILPIYEKIIDNGKGPRLFTKEGSVVAPDLITFNGKSVVFVEAKRKSGFTWHRVSGKWTTGIDRHHYREYLRLEKLLSIPVWLLFLQHGKETKDCPAGLNQPSGLFAGDLSRLANCVNHEHEGWGAYGMVYWAESSLKKLDTIEGVTSVRTFTSHSSN